MTASTTLHRPQTLSEALEIRARLPEAVPIQGGTDLLVDLNFRRLAPGEILDLSAVEELRRIDAANGSLRLGAGVTYAQVIAHGDPGVAALAVASRTVGSVQIRNRGTIGGNLGTASPAGDAHPPLLALGAEVELVSEDRSRLLPIGDFFTGPGRSALAADELIAAIHVPLVEGGQEFSKVGARNAMIIAACSFAVAIDPVRRRVGTGIGSAGPTPLRAERAEAFLAGLLEEGDAWEAPAPSEVALDRFGELGADAAQPIDDVRASAEYRRHALRVMGRRALGWACGTSRSDPRG
jgi:CO/xanthine dehydrogenase FAD-binding subunit